MTGPDLDPRIESVQGEFGRTMRVGNQRGSGVQGRITRQRSDHLVATLVLARSSPLCAAGLGFPVQLHGDERGRRVMQGLAVDERGTAGAQPDPVLVATALLSTQVGSGSRAAG